MVINVGRSLALVCLFWTGSLRADQHVILDTTKEAMLDWTRFPYGPTSPTPGWVEESFTNFEKSINWRSYVVCDVSYNNVNNWLWTPFITRGNANRLYIEIKFSLRNCDLFPGNAVQCKETFSLLYYEFDVATREPPPWETESYKLIDQIAADMGRFTDTNEVIINTEVRSIDVTKRGVYFAFRDQGACLSLLAVKVYYLTCPETTVGYAFYPETPTGAEVTSVEKISGTCVKNAVAISEPYSLCKGEGTWAYPSGRCACMAGYEANEATQTCNACPVGRFKHTSGEGPCLICPPHSQALYAGSVECRCNEGYYRAQPDPRTAECTRPPSAPRNLKKRFLDPTTLVLTWDPPSDEGGRSDTQYKVECDVCSLHIAFSPQFPSGQTNVTLSHLQQGSTYNIKIFAMNGVSNISLDTENYAEVSVSTGSGAPSVVSNLMISDQKPHQLSLSWLPPTDPLLEIDLYEVRYFVRGQKANMSNLLITKNEMIEIPKLTEGTEYGLQVRARTNRGWGEFSSPLYAKTHSEVDPVFMGADKDSTPARVAIGVVISIVLLVVLVVIAFFMYRRNLGHRWTKQKHPERDCDSSLDYRSMDPHFVGSVGESLPIVQTHSAGGTTIPPGLYNPFSLHKTYVDPHTYEDPNIAVKQFAKEIDARYISIEAIIGGGEFGDVCRGRLSHPDMLVAIKTLKPGSSEKARNDFLTEASIMGQFEHPNVIFLQGVVTKSNPIMIITEFMENGSLDTFLRANDGKFQIMQLVGMMRGIAYGMQYLAEMNFVHRDLAARNVLVNSQLVCKIADFGLSREISDANVDGAYTTRGGKIPVRWTAPEAIAFRKFTSASDVWSFGIVMWEVMSYGERPYWTWSNQDVIKAIDKTYRLPAPMDCPEAIHQLMLDCWQKERGHRPSFPSIVKTLDKLICCPETLKKIAKSPMHNPYAVNAPDYRSFASVDEWLTYIKMNRYSDNFSQAGITSLDDVSKLTLQQLVDIGITLVGHQKKIMGSIQSMRAQISVNISEGFLV